MNAESLKTELQHVLDNDVVLRKEFNDLKRSLSDYRNQLIMRDEDCKRLQVTIDVLNTKLLVLERDNTNYKGELTSFKELRGSIKEQLDAKQEEIDTRLNEIQDLKNDLNSMAADYELKIENIKNVAADELERVSSEFSSQINELKSTSFYKESGIKDEYENRLSELTMQWADKEQSLAFYHEEEIIALTKAHALEVSQAKKGYEEQLSSLGNFSQNETAELRSSHSSTMALMVDDYNSALEKLEKNYKCENAELLQKLEQQHYELSSSFEREVEDLKNEQSLKESIFISGYEQQINDLKSFAYSGTQEMSLNFQNQVEDLKSSHQNILNEKESHFLLQLENLSSKYEERLSNTLIHSTSQNSKLTEELGKAQFENDQFQTKIRGLSIHLDSQATDIESLSLQLSNLKNSLNIETQRFSEISTEFENFKQNSSLSNSEQVNELNNQINNLNIAHIENLNGLNLKIEQLDEEFTNLTTVFESTTNLLGETEISLEFKSQELSNASVQIEDLNLKISEIQHSFGKKDSEFEKEKTDLSKSFKLAFDNKELEYQKLLIENANVINEIDLAQDKVEAQEAEIAILKSEFDDLKSQSIGKSERFKEILANKNFEVTNLEANNAAFTEELSHVKAEMLNLREQTLSMSNNSEEFAALQNAVTLLKNEKNNLMADLTQMQTVVAGLNAQLLNLNEKLIVSESEISSLKSASKTEEQEAFIDRLFKQIDLLNDQHLALLDEKDQMASQLLKMSDVVGVLSQQVDSEKIDVTGLNNHRKNVIFAKNSSESDERSHMKEQINDLVREIDKCIALLSA